jgi:hypothetical protein
LHITDDEEREVLPELQSEKERDRRSKALQEELAAKEPQSSESESSENEEPIANLRTT